MFKRLPLPDIITHMRLTQRKGDSAVAQAIATFTRMGFDVSIPLTESAAYDLIVDADGTLRRVQVRYAGNTNVDLRRVHSNSKGYVVKKTVKQVYDWLFVLTGENKKYLIRECLIGRRSVKPSAEHLLSEEVIHV
jgi:PD-(D/E)XK endonuclease